MASRSIFVRVLTALWRGVDYLRRFLHLIFLLFLFSVLIAVLVPQHIAVPDSAALIIAPAGTLVDQLSGDPVDRALAELQGNGRQETLLKDLIDAVRYAKSDPRIQALFLRLDGMSASGLSKLQELAAEIESFKESGKRVIASGDGYTRDQYYLASMADEIYLHPMGMILIEGYGRFMPYYRSALDKLYVDVNVWTAGEYKSFVEPYTRDGMSPEDREASSVYLDVLWSEYQSDVTARRSLDRVTLQRMADNYAEGLADSGGDTAQMALDFGLVDDLLSRGEVNDRMREIVGADEEESYAFSAIDSASYLASQRLSEVSGQRDQKIAVLTLAGPIYDGSQSPGAVGGDSTARMIREIANDDDVKALVLRVDSPGGSAFASEVILDEIEAFQDSERPLVVSMGSVAASGGYWVSMSADEIWASPTTITGSIGVGAILPTVPRTLDKLGVHVDGIGTTELAGQMDPMRGLSDDVSALYGQTVSNLYAQFIGKVASFRGQSVDEIDRVARGRVWTGQHAREFGLVDELGDLTHAIEAAARLANLQPDQYDVDYVEQELSFAESLALEFADILAPVFRTLRIELPWSSHVSEFLKSVVGPESLLDRLNDPRGIYTYCFCDVR